ncbi:regulatory protein, gntR family [Nonomuraea maritima]|uniref:Regulatory protein, gntR family n=1 Tax=Nonomuraea maritima TaxID=683260 RepID=A0A1G9MQK1_9ACTN|nr:GntR family transcriptional regulator [Nonomuraea maritima]SDL76538.1 regulatory protein, gntR family [Nonomuraea maritima]
MPMPPAKAERIADVLAQAIRRGDHPPGSRLPSERDLASTHGADRSTIRNAISLLVDQGLVSRIPRQGVKVSDPGVPVPVREPARAESEIACGRPHACRTLAGMTAWLTSQDRLTVVRVDDIVSVQIVVPGEADERLHPTKRLDRAEEARIVVGSSSGVTMCAATCPGRDALWAWSELMAVVSSLMQPTSEHREMYVHAPASWPRRRPERLWQVSSKMPEPELVH